MDLWWISKDNKDVFFCAQQKLFVFAAFKTAWSHPKDVCQTNISTEKTGDAAPRAYGLILGIPLLGPK